MTCHQCHRCELMQGRWKTVRLGDEACSAHEVYCFIINFLYNTDFRSCPNTAETIPFHFLYFFLKELLYFLKLLHNPQRKWCPADLKQECEVLSFQQCCKCGQDRSSSGCHSVLQNSPIYWQIKRLQSRSSSPVSPHYIVPCLLIYTDLNLTLILPIKKKTISLSLFTPVSLPIFIT